MNRRLILTAAILLTSVTAGSILYATTNHAHVLPYCHGGLTGETHYHGFFSIKHIH